MYQSPDFIKVELDVKDNFASYGGCYRNSYSVNTKNELVVPDGNCEVETLLTYAAEANDYQCFYNQMSY